MKRAVIVGATSGIGREVARILSESGYDLGLTGRRADRLAELQAQLVTPSCCRCVDLTRPSEAMAQLEQLIDDLGGLDLLVISAGTGYINPELMWDLENETIAVNVTGFVALCNVAFRHFARQRAGHIVGITSVAAITGDGHNPAYNASKAFESVYLEGLRQKAYAERLPITITEIRPGYVDTPMAKGDRVFWVAPPAKAARQICRAINRRREHAYVTRRWRLVAWLLKVAPRWLRKRL